MNARRPLLSSHDDRRELARRVKSALETASPGSTVFVRGSIAAGTDDDVSDVDLAWFVTAAQFTAALGSLPRALAEAGSVESLRLDPDTDPPLERALVFARFADRPLFLRLDLEVRRVSAPGHPAAARPVAWAPDWSAPESALMNALATVKALHRSQPDVADGLLQRGFERVGAPDPGGGWTARIQALSEAAVGRDPQFVTLASDVLAVAAELLPPD